MRPTVNLIKKELRELLTPTTLIPMALIVVMFISLGSMINMAVDEATSGQLERIGLLNADDTTTVVVDYSAVAIDEISNIYGADYASSVIPFDASLYGDDQGIMNEMKDKGLSVLLVITPTYSENINNELRGVISIYYHQSDLKGLINSSESTANALILAINAATSNEILSGIPGAPDFSFISAPAKNVNFLILNGTVHEGYAPSQMESALSTQNMFVSIMIMMVIVMIGSILISSMGSEKENKTLETLLTLPVNRTAVVGGKIIGSAIVGLIFGAVYLVGLYLGMGRTMGAGSGNILGELGVSLTIVDWAIVGVFLFMAILAALGICMILGAFAKNYKAAQTLIMPIMIMAMVPMFINMFSSFDALPPVLQGVMFALPFSHPMMVMGNLIFGNMTMILAGFVYLLLFCLVTLYVTVRLYKSDILLTGFIKKDKGSGRSLPWKRSKEN